MTYLLISIWWMAGVSFCFLLMYASKDFKYIRVYHIFWSCVFGVLGPAVVLAVIIEYLCERDWNKIIYIKKSD